MKRTFFCSIASAVLLVFILFSCHKEDILVESVSLNITKDTLDVNDTLTLVAIIEPEDAFNQFVRWISADETVATVDREGVVTAIAPGTTAIIVTTIDGSFTAACTITVIKQVSNITLNNKELSLFVGENETLIATIVPNDSFDKTVIWTSNNNVVATVNNNGMVTAISAGTATIKVATQDGAKYDECVVTVSTPIVPVESIVFNKSALAFTVGDAAEKLIATVLPAYATNKDINWISSKPTVATVSNDGTVTPVTAGTAIIIATTVDGGKTAICNVTVEELNTSVLEVDLPDVLTIEGSEIKSLTASILPLTAINKNVTWTSSDSTVAIPSGTGLTVDITPVAPAVGDVAPRTATITVTTEDGNKTVTCTVTVNYVAVTGVTVTPATVSKNVSESETLTATVLPANASIKTVKWESSSSAAMVFANGVITATATGTATITATSDADNTKTGTCIVTVNL